MIHKGISEGFNQQEFGQQILLSNINCPAEKC